jgi:maleylpyruvate isomerase
VIGEDIFDRGRLPELRVHLIGSTQALLGDTIGLSDDEWQSAAGLPGWTRAHVASHLAQQAGRLTALIGRLLAGEKRLAWPIAEPDIDLEAGSRRRALELQVALDTSSGQLLETMDRLTPDDWEVRLRTPLGPLAAVALTYGRLNEVVLHRLDLRLGVTFADLDATIVEWLLEWNALRLRSRLRHGRIHLLSDEGLDLVVGSGAATADVRGVNSSLLGWLTGRLDHTAVLGADQVDLGGPL